MRWVVTVIVAAIAAASSNFAIAGTYAHGVGGGTIRGRFYGSVRHGVECNIAVPDSFVIQDVKFARDRVVVVACVEHNGANGNHRLTSELWHFVPPDSSATVVTYSDRTVLYSAESTYGESYKMLSYSVNGFQATAVFQAEWEGGSAFLFDRRGQAMPLDRDKIALVCSCRPDMVLPLAWIERGREEYLVLSIAEFEGKDGVYIEYCAADGSIEVIQPEGLSGAVVGKLLIGIIGQK